MTFPLKSAITTIAALVVVYGGYFTWILSRLDDDVTRGFAYKPLLVLSVVPLAVLMGLGHGVLAARAPGAADAYDERDRQIGWRSGLIGGQVLAVGVFAGLVLALFEVSSFVLANALLLAWVLAELADRIAKVVFYVRGS